MNDSMKSYLQEVKRRLPCGRREKWRCGKELEADVSAFLGAHPNATLEDLYAAFGSPQDIAEAYMARTDPKRVSRKRYWVIGLVIAAILAIVIGVLAAVTAHKRQAFYGGYYVDQVTVYESLPSEAEAEAESTPIAEY